MSAAKRWLGEFAKKGGRLQGGRTTPWKGEVEFHRESNRGRAMQEQLPSLHTVNEHFFGKFNDARASKVIFQRFLNFKGINLAAYASTKLIKGISSNR